MDVTDEASPWVEAAADSDFRAETTVTVRDTYRTHCGRRDRHIAAAPNLGRGDRKSVV